LTARFAAKGLAVGRVHWFMGEDGWTFDNGPRVLPNPIAGARRLYQLYLRSNPRCTGPGNRSGALGQRARRDRVERVVRNNPHDDLRLRRGRRVFGGFLSCRAAGTDRCSQYAHLRHLEQRRLQSRLCDDAGCVRGSRAPALLRCWNGWRTGSQQTDICAASA